MKRRKFLTFLGIGVAAGTVLARGKELAAENEAGKKLFFDEYTIPKELQGTAVRVLDEPDYDCTVGRLNEFEQRYRSEIGKVAAERIDKMIVETLSKKDWDYWA